MPFLPGLSKTEVFLRKPNEEGTALDHTSPHQGRKKKTEGTELSLPPSHDLFWVGTAGLRLRRGLSGPRLWDFLKLWKLILHGRPMTVQTPCMPAQKPQQKSMLLTSSLPGGNINQWLLRSVFSHPTTAIWLLRETGC